MAGANGSYLYILIGRVLGNPSNTGARCAPPVLQYLHALQDRRRQRVVHASPIARLGWRPAEVNTFVTLKYIDPDRLALIPPRHRVQHEFCFYIHDVMVNLLKEAETHRVSTVQYRFKDNAEAEAFKKRNDPISFFIENGQRDVAMQITLNQVNLALYADLLHFVHEALKALEKRKFVVAFALLRKPLKQSLMFATWMCADAQDFFTQLERSPADYMEEKDLPKERRLELLKMAIARLENPDLLDAQTIYDIVFDKNLKTGLAPLFDKAAHLVTSRGVLVKTEVLNLNFIFKNLGDNDLYDTVYLRLAYILIYLMLLQVTLYSRMQGIEKRFSDWILLTSLGAYQSLFVKGRSPLINSLNKALAEFLTCPHCRTDLKIKKSYAARFFVTQELHCQRCNADHHFPLFWLLSKSQWSFSGKADERVQTNH